jgi:hypothetical protein
MNLCPHSIPIDDYCPKCDAGERRRERDKDDAAFRRALDGLADADCERERATLEDAMRNEDRIWRNAR